MNILLTGASGFLGQKLIQELLRQKKHKVKALVHISPLKMDRCEIVNGDLGDINSLIKATIGVDTVVHLAAVTHTNKQKDYFRINATGTRNLLNVCSQNGVQRFIFMSSRAVHLEGGSYSESKMIAENHVKKSNMAWVIIQPSEIYGFGTSDAINKLIVWIKKYKFIPVIGDGQYKVSPAFIDDIIPSIRQAIVKKELRNATFILAGPEEMTFNSLLDRMCSLFNVKRYKIFVPAFLVDMFLRILLLFKKEFFYRDQIPRLLCQKRYSIDLAVKHLNFKPRSLEEGLKLAIGSM